jgi:hypothetical protein
MQRRQTRLRRASISLRAIKSGLNTIQEVALIERLGQIADDPSLKCAGANIIARIGRYHDGGISFPNRDRLLCRSRPFILGMSKSTTRHPARLSSGERKKSSPDENAWATNPIERIKTLIAFPTASSSSTMATIGPLFGTWQDRQPRDSFHRTTDVAREILSSSNLGATATCFDYTIV